MIQQQQKFGDDDVQGLSDQSEEEQMNGSPKRIKNKTSLNLSMIS